MSSRSKGIAFEKLTWKANKPKPEFETFGQTVGEFVLAILVVGVLYMVGNLVLGLN